MSRVISLILDIEELTPDSVVIVQSEDFETAKEICQDLHLQFDGWDQSRFIALSPGNSLEWVNEAYMNKHGWYRRNE